MYQFEKQLTLHTQAKIPEVDKLLRTIWVPVHVKPHPRPRIMGWGGPNPRVYQPLRAQQIIARAIRGYVGPEPIEQPIIVHVCSIFPQAKKIAKHPVAGQYGDYDNLLKNVLDAMVRIKILDDDRWVLGGESYKVFGKDHSLFIQIWSVKE